MTEAYSAKFIVLKVCSKMERVQGFLDKFNWCHIFTQVYDILISDKNTLKIMWLLLNG